MLPSIDLPGQSMFPGVVTLDPESLTLYTAGVADGSIVAVRPCYDEPSVVAKPGTFGNVFGVTWDAGRDGLWVCNDDLSFVTAPRLELLDVDSGEVLASHSFGGAGLCNEIVVDDGGNVYATDSVGHRIVRVSSQDALSDSPVETWAAPPEFDAGPDFGLNGITFDGERFYVVFIPTGSLFAVEIDGQGAFAGASEISLESGPLVGAEAIYSLNDGTLLSVENFGHRISLIDLDKNDEAEVTLIEDGLDFPTSAAVIGGSLWVVEGEVDHLLGFNPDPPELPFQLVRVEFQ